MSAAGTARTRSWQSEPTPPRRVLVLSETTGLAALLEQLLGRTGVMCRFASLREALEGGDLDGVDTVVVDLYHGSPHTLIAQVRHHWRGRLILLGDPSQRVDGLPPEPVWTLLTRPFSTYALGAALDLPGYERYQGVASVPERRAPVSGQQPVPPTPATAPGIKAAIRRAATWWQLATVSVDRHKVAKPVSRVLAAVSRIRQARRRVQVAGLLALASIAFAVAFAIASRSPCGPGCDDVIRTGVLPTPMVTTGEPAGGPVSAVRGRKRRPPSGQRVPSTNALQGGASGRAHQSIMSARRTTTTGRLGSAGASTAPTTAPVTTPTTAPVTTPTTAPVTTPTTAPATTPTTAPVTTPTTAPAIPTTG